MNPAGAGTNIIQQALPSPIEPMSPYASWASPGGDEDPLERFVDNLGPGVGTVRTSTPINNAPPAGAGTPLRASTPVRQGNVVGVGATTSTTPPRRLTAAERGKQAAGPAGRVSVAQKAPRRRPRAPTPSSPSDAGSRRRSSASNGSGNGGRRRSGGGGGGGGGGDGDDDDDDDDDDDGDTTPSSIAGPSRRRRRRRRADRVLNDAEMQQQLAQILQDQRQTAADRRIAGITTTNTITTTYKNGRRPTVTRNSTSVRN